MSAPVAVVGAGGFGRGLALAAARVGRRVILWSREARAVDNANVQPTRELADIAEAELVLVAVRAGHVSELADRMARYLDGRHLLVHVSRGLVGENLTTVSEVLRQRTPARRVGALAGPLVAHTLATGEPGGGVIGSLFPEVAEAVTDAIAGPKLRIYRTDDLVGVELASALGGIVALALGVAQAMRLGPGTSAVLATRGLFEAARIGAGRGALERTFAGLAGAGDLIAAVAGDGRPEIEFGRALGEGASIADATARAGGHVEGAHLATLVAAWAERRRAKAPLARALAAMLSGQASSEKVLRELMERPLGTE